MTDRAITISINQVAALIERELETETGTERVCRLLDAKEYLRRSYCALNGMPCEDNDTTIETLRKMQE